MVPKAVRISASPPLFIAILFIAILFFSPTSTQGASKYDYLVPCLNQLDYSNIGHSACGPTCLAMILQYYFPNSVIDVPEVYHSGIQGYNYNGPAKGYKNVSFQYPDPGLEIVEEGFREYYGGNYSGMYSGAAAHYLNLIWGGDSLVREVDYQEVIDEIKSRPVILNILFEGKRYWVDDHWELSGHYVLLRGYDDQGTLEDYHDDVFFVNDPWKGQENRKFSFDKLFGVRKWVGNYTPTGWFKGRIITFEPTLGSEQREYTTVVDNGYVQLDNVEATHGDGNYVWQEYYGLRDGTHHGDWYYPIEGGHWAKWKPSLPMGIPIVEGLYELHIIVRKDNEQDKVTYRLHDAYEADHTIIIDQKGTGWVDASWGVFALNEDSFVQIDEVPAKCNVDAIRFEYVGPLPAELALDIYFLVDLSGSFTDDLPHFKTQAAAMVAELKSHNANIRFGLGKFEDYPIPPFGDAAYGDKPYERLVDLTFNTDLVLNTIQDLFTRSGDDWPQSQLAALYQAATGEGQDLSGVGYPEASIPSGQQANFRKGALKIAVLWTDAPFHRPGDPGDIPYPGPSFSETIAALLKGGVIPIPASADMSGALLPMADSGTPIKVIGISSGTGAVADLKEIAFATGALAPPGGVDYDGDGVIDIPEGEPLVCAIASTGEGIADAIIATVEAIARFDYSDLEVHPTVVCPGEEVRASATVRNIGTSAGTDSVVLKVDDLIRDTKTTSLGPDESTVVEFHFTFGEEEIGEHVITINGLLPVTVHVLSAQLFNLEFVSQEAAEAAGWTFSGLWHLTSEAECDAFSPNPTPFPSSTHAAHFCGTSGTYAGPASLSLGSLSPKQRAQRAQVSPMAGQTKSYGELITPNIHVTSQTQVDLRFHYFRAVEHYTEGSYDKTYVQVQFSGSGWQTVWSLDSKTPSEKAWTEAGPITISVPAGASVMRIKFVFDSVDSYGNDYLGWLIDDISISGPEPVTLRITTQGLPSGTVTQTYSATLSAAGGTPPYTWSATGLPAGLSLNSSTGLISGTPTSPGTSTVTATVTDSATGTATREYQFAVNPEPVGVLYEEDFTDPTGWTVGELWHTTAALGCVDLTGHGAVAYYGIDAACNYSTGDRTSGELTSPPIDVSSAVAVQLRFDHFRQVEYFEDGAYDQTYIQARLGDGTWKTIWASDSTYPSEEAWTQVTVGPFATGGTQTLQLRFGFDSVDRWANGFIGWLVDNVRVEPAASGSPLSAMAIQEAAPRSPADLIFVFNVPNPVRDVYTTQFVVRGVEAETIRVEVYDLSGRLVWEGEGLGNELPWHTEGFDGLSLANGVYIYRVYVKVDGDWIVTGIQKLVILR